MSMLLRRLDAWLEAWLSSSTCRGMMSSWKQVGHGLLLNIANEELAITTHHNKE